MHPSGGGREQAVKASTSPGGGRETPEDFGPTALSLSSGVPTANEILLGGGAERANVLFIFHRQDSHQSLGSFLPFIS